VFGRREITRQELVRSEFGDSLGHVRQAAVHAAGGLGATVGPNYGKARDRITSARGMVGPTATRLSRSASNSWDTTLATLGPLVQAARDGAMRANEMNIKPMKRTTKVIEETETPEGHTTRNAMALIACGAAVGAAGALVARRRNRSKWAEYEPSAIESDASSMLDPSVTATTSMQGKGDKNVIKKAGGWTKGQTKSAYDSVRHKIHDATADREKLDMEATDRAAMQGTTSEMASEDRTAMKQANEGSSHFDDTESRMKDAQASADDTTRSNKNTRK
jgi:hypothetical protein